MGYLTIEIINGSLKKLFVTGIWLLVIVIAGLTVYVNYYLPHGPMYPTGDIVCENDDRGPCSGEYKEDLTNLNIPNWAKLFRSSDSKLLLLGLVFAGIVVTTKNIKD
jgi:hypothetical protein